MTAASPHRVPHRRRRGMQWLARWLVSALSHADCHGLDRLPQGPAIIAPNHLGHADALLMLAALPTPPEIIALSDLVEEQIAPLVWLYNPLLVNRDRYDRVVVATALNALDQGSQLLLFPEARISVSGALERARGGVGYLALKARVPVVPVALTGTEGVKQSLLSGKRPSLTLTVGAQILPAEVPDAPPREQRAWLTTELMTRIARLLPPAYRGVYGDHSK